MSQRTVVLELAGDHQLARDLVAGGVFVPGVQLERGEECALVLRGKGAVLTLSATCVWIDARGSGLQLAGCDAEMKQHILSLARASTADVVAIDEPDPAADDPDALAIEQALAALSPDELDALDAAASDPGADVDDLALPHVQGPTSASTAEAPVASGGERKSAQSVNERLRGLTLVQQLKVAQHGELSERVLLERLYGKNVWEPLLRNPRITGPEVARIARMGALPRTLLELIVGNGGWLQIPEVRRALLSNPRLGTDQLLRVLRLLPKHELKVVSTQTAYSFAVRDAAKRIIRDSGG